MVPRIGKISLAIFDLDGVIYDVTGPVKDAARDVIEKYRLPGSVDETLGDLFPLIEKLQAVPIPRIILGSYDLLRIPALEGMTLIKRLRVLMDFYARYREYKDAAEVFPSIPKLIRDLAAAGVKLAVQTNQKADYARDVLDKVELSRVFSLILGYNEVSKPKPDPEGIRKIMERLGVTDPSRVVYVGDMATDVRAGKAAGVKTVAVATGLVPPEKLRAEGPDVLLEGVEGLGKVLL
ncbi:MAG: HAD family hydrolase [Promethearchaeota archaeon]